MNSIPNSAKDDKPLDRKAHLAKQLERNRAYRDALWLTTVAPWPPYPDELAEEIARVSRIVLLIEIDLGLPLPVAALLTQADADNAAMAEGSEGER